MNTRTLLRNLGVSVAALALLGCATGKSYDYTNFREHPPRSILVLPPLNESMSVEGPYGYLSTVTRPLAELGYYVYPVAIVDQFLKENGMPTSGEMHQAPLNKVAEIIGADAVMYVTLKEYGTKYALLDSVPTVSAIAKLVDTRTGVLLWEGAVVLRQNSRGSGNIFVDMIGAAIAQAVNTSTDRAHKLCGPANAILFTGKDRGLLYGPYRPEGADAGSGAARENQAKLSMN